MKAQGKFAETARKVVRVALALKEAGAFAFFFEAATAKKIHEKLWPAVLEDVGVQWGKSVLDAIVE